MYIVSVYQLTNPSIDVVAVVVPVFLLIVLVVVIGVCAVVILLICRSKVSGS